MTSGAAAPGLGLVLAIAAGFLAAVVLTQYPEGGGLEWGGRFLSPIVVPLAVLAVAGFRLRLAGIPRPDLRLAIACLGVVALATAGLGIFAIAEGRSDNDRVIAAFSRHPAPVMVTTVPEVGLLAWRTHAQLTWMFTDEPGLADLFRRLEDGGLSHVAVVTDGGSVGGRVVARGVDRAPRWTSPPCARSAWACSSSEGRPRRRRDRPGCLSAAVPSDGCLTGL